MKHTPGPWTATPWAVCSGTWALANSATKSAEVRSPEQREANMKLMAASPEMLEALKTAQTALAIYANSDFDLTARTALAQVDEVIAKAEGK